MSHWLPENSVNLKSFLNSKILIHRIDCHLYMSNWLKYVQISEVTHRLCGWIELSFRTRSGRIACMRRSRGVFRYLPHPRQSYSTFDLDLVTLPRIQSNVINDYERPSQKATARTQHASHQGARHSCSVSAARAQGLGKAPRRFSRRLRADRLHFTADGHHCDRNQVRESGARL